MFSKKFQINGLILILVTENNIINGYKSILAYAKSGVHQSSILAPLFFEIFINDLHVVIKYSEVHHLTDDTNLLNFQSFLNL